MKRILAFALSICTLFSLFAVYAAAEEGEQQGEFRHVSLTETTVIEDLEALEKAQKDDPNGFKLSDYPVVPGSKTVKFLSLTEDYRKTDEGFQYGLYLYVYNPGRLVIQPVDNKLQLSIEGVNDNHFYKLDVSTISFSSDKLFYKFRVIIPSALKSFMSAMSDMDRIYNISGIELSADYGDGNITPVDHLCTADGKIEKTIKIQYTGNNPSVCSQIAGDDLLHLDIKLGYYHVSNGADTNSYKQLMTAWFTMPKKYFDQKEFLGLKTINYSCMKKDDLTVMVGGPSNVFVHNSLKMYVPSEDGGHFETLDVLAPTKILFSVYDQMEIYQPAAWGFPEKIIGRTKKHNLFFTYSLDEPDRKKFQVSGESILSENAIDVVIPYHYGVGRISSQKLYALMNGDSSYIYKYKVWDTHDIGFVMDVTDPANNYNTESYKEATKGLSGFWNRVETVGFLTAIRSAFDSSAIEDDSLDDLQPFVVVDDNDVDISLSDFTKKYKLDDATARSIRTKMGDLSDECICLFRFDLADYNILFDGVTGQYADAYSSLMNHYVRSSINLDSIKIGLNEYPFANILLFNSLNVYRCAMYQKFDILDFGFSTPEGYKIVPVNADPVKFYMADLVPKEDLKPVAKVPNLNFAPLLISALVVMVSIALIVPIARATGKVYDGTVKVGKSAAKKIKQMKRRKKRR